MSRDHYSIRPSRRAGASTSDSLTRSERVASQSKKQPPLLPSAAVPSSTHVSLGQLHHFPSSSTKPHTLPPINTGISSFQPANQLMLPKTKPPPVPKRRAKSNANYYSIDRNLRSALPVPSTVSCPIMESNPTAKHSNAADGSDNCYHKHTSSSASTIYQISQTTDEAFPLAEFVSLYKHSLPLRIRVKEGYCGKEERSVISAGDVYNFHFIKNETVLSVEDEGGKAFSVPLNSSVKFGLLHNPNGDETKSFTAFSYRTVGDFVSCSVPPRVVRATQNFSSGETASAVEAGEVLIVKEITRTVHDNICVKAFSLHTHKQKILYQDCMGCFLTDPCSVQLFVNEIVDHLKDSLPLKATLFLDSDIDVSDSRLSSLASEVVTLKRTDVESFIIATTCWDENDAIPDIATDRDDLIPVAITTDLKISVIVLGDQSESESLYEDTRQLYENFDPSKVYAVCGSLDNSDDYAPLVQSVRSGYEYQGLDIIKPSKIYSEEYYTTPNNTCQTSQQHQSSKLPTLHIKEQIEQNEVSLCKRSCIKSELEGEVEELRSQLKQALSQISDLADKYDGLQREVMKLKSNTGNVARKTFVVTDGNACTRERNVKELKTLSCKQIQGLMQTMNFTQYLKMFRDEEIDGQLLSECDESVLQHELGIPSVIHRAKLMKIITGRQSAVDILKR